MSTDLWNHKNFKIVDDVFSDDCVSKNPVVDTQGIEEYKHKVVLPLLDAFPDLCFVSNEVITEGNAVVNRWTFFGTHRKAYLGFEPTDRKCSWTGVTISRFNPEGRMTEVLTFFDLEALKKQLAGTS